MGSDHTWSGTWGAASGGLLSLCYSSLPVTFGLLGWHSGSAGCLGGRCEVDWWVCRGGRGSGDSSPGGLLLGGRVRDGSTSVVLR